MTLEQILAHVAAQLISEADAATAIRILFMSSQPSSAPTPAPAKAKSSALPMLIGEAEAARFLGLSVGMLRKDRLGAQQIPVVRIGHAVRYSVAELELFSRGKS